MEAASAKIYHLAGLSLAGGFGTVTTAGSIL
jgi:hypothetical protein